MIRRHRPSIRMASFVVVLGIGSGSVPAVLPGDLQVAAPVLTSPGSDQAQQVAELRRLGGTVFERDGAVIEVNLNRTGVRDDDLDRLAGFRAMTDLSLEQTTIGDDGLLSAIVEELEKEGFRVLGADQLLEAEPVPEGPLGKICPDAQSEADIAHGLLVVRAIGALDIGQAVVVQQGLVLGVEAIEGTDELVRRCGALRREGPGGVLIKVEKPGQERRTDRPTIGPRTVMMAAEAGLSGIAIEADATIVLDREEVIRGADRAGLFVVGVRHS